MKNRVDIIREFSNSVLDTLIANTVIAAAADNLRKFPIPFGRRIEIEAENKQVNKKRTGSGGGGDLVASGVGSGLYDSGKIEKLKDHKFMKDSYHPQNTTNNFRFIDIKESVNLVVSLFEADKTREQRQQERLQHSIAMERSREELRQLRQQRRDRETAEADQRTMARYSGANEKSELDRLQKGTGVDPKIAEKIAALPAAGTLERAKAIQKLAIAQSYAGAAETERNFHTTDLGRQAAEFIVKRDKLDLPPPGKIFPSAVILPSAMPGAGLEGIALAAINNYFAVNNSKEAVDARTKAILDASGKKARDEMNALRQAENERKRQTQITGRKGVSWEEAGRIAAELERGWRAARIAKIGEHDPFIANNLDSMHRSVERERRTTAAFGEIHRDATVEADRIRDEMAARDVERLKRNLGIGDSDTAKAMRDAEAARDAESVRAADEASRASEARINKHYKDVHGLGTEDEIKNVGPSRWLKDKKPPQIGRGAAPYVNLPTTPSIQVGDPNSWWNAPKVSTQAQVGGEERKPKGVGGFDELEPGEGPATTRVGQVDDLIKSSVQQINKDVGRKRSGSAFA